METIPKKDCTKIGFIRKIHGVKGEVILEFEPQFYDYIEEAIRFFVELDGLLVPFFVKEEGLHIKSEKTAVVAFEWIESGDYAKRLAGKPVYLFKNDVEIIPKEFSIFDLKGFLLFDNNSGEIGKIERVEDFSGNIVFSVMHNSKEILIPFNEELLISMNLKNRILVLNLPDGLMDVGLNN